MSGSRATSSKDSVRRPSGIVTVPGVGASTSSRKDVKLCQSVTSSPACTTTVKSMSPRSPGTGTLSMGTRTSTTPATTSKSTPPSSTANDTKLNRTAVITRTSRPSSAPETKNKSLPTTNSVATRPSTTDTTSRPLAPTLRQMVTSSVTSTRGKPQLGSSVTSSARQRATLSSAAKQTEVKSGSRAQSGNETRSRDGSRSAFDGSMQSIMDRREFVDIENNTSAMPQTSATPAAAAAGGGAGTPGEIHQKCINSRTTRSSDQGDKGVGGGGAGQVATISVCSENTTTTGAPPDKVQVHQADVVQGACADTAAELDRKTQRNDQRRDDSSAVEVPAPDALAAAGLVAPASELNSDCDGTPAENDLMRSSSSAPTDCSQPSDSATAAETELVSCADHFTQSDLANGRGSVNDVDDSVAASCSSQTDSSVLDTTADDDVTDADSVSEDDVVTTTSREANYFTVTARDRDSPTRSSGSYTCESNDTTPGGGVRNAGSSNAHVERRICEIAAELSERNSIFIYTKQKSRDAVSNGGGEDVEGRLLRLEQTCDRLTRENSALSDLLTAKKLECVETRQWYRGRVKDLEDDVSRLKMEKCRLLDRLQLPESERASLMAEENALAELRRKLEETEEKLEVTRNENVELRQDLRDAELAMQELHDQFQAEESIELRELQRELENTSRDCRLLHFKLRKAERRNEQLQGEFDELQLTTNRLADRSNEDRRKVRQLSEELSTAKDISIRLHDECERLQAECHAYRQKLSRDSSSLGMSEAGSNRSSISKTSGEQLLNESIDDRSNGNSETDHVTTLDNHVIVTVSAPSDGGEENSCRERELSENELQLSRAEREINQLHGRVTELSNENEDLMKAVSYLRSKLESNSSSVNRQSLPVDDLSMDNISPVPNDSLKLGNGFAVDDVSHRQSNDRVDMSASDVIDNSIAHSSSDKDVAIPNIRTLEDHSVKCREKLDNDMLGVSTVNNGRLAELEEDNRELLNELRAVSEDNSRLESELITSRRDLDAMLDLLRRKERQFTDERKVLQKKNKELAEIFDLFAERRHKRSAYYSTDDVSTQTDDVILLTTSIDEGRKCNAGKNKRSLPNVEKLIQDKDDVIDKLNQSILSKEISLSEALTRLDDLESSLRVANNAAAERKKQIDKSNIALESIMKQLSDSKQVIESISNRTQQLEDTVKQRDAAVLGLSRDLAEKISQVESLTMKVEDLSEKLNEAKRKLQDSTENDKQLKMELSETRALVEELERNLTSARAACDLQQLAAKNEKSRFEEKMNFLMATNESLLEELRHAKVIATGPHSDAPLKINSPQTRRTTIITVKHQKTSTSPPQPEAITHENGRLETLEEIPKTIPDLDINRALDPGIELTKESSTEEVVMVTPRATPSTVRRREHRTSQVPTSFRRSRSMSEVDVIADELVYIVEPAEQLELTLYPQDIVCAPSSEFISQPPQCDDELSPITSSQSTDVTVRLRHRPPANAASAHAHRGSFYASGTLSASASREQSLDRDGSSRNKPRRREVRRICDYPLAPPSMIITPTRTPVRSLSSDRSKNDINKTELVQRLSDIIVNDGVTSGRDSRGRSGHRACASVNGQVFLSADVGRSFSVSPRTARRQFYDGYPTTTRRPQTCMTSSYNSMTLPLTSARDKVAQSESTRSGLELTAVTSQDGLSTVPGSSGALSQFKKTKIRMSFLRFPTLPFFRKKNNNKTEQKSTQGDVISSCPVSSASDVTEHPQLQVVTTRTLTSFEPLKDKRMSRSQPLQSSGLVSSLDTLTSSQLCRSHVNASQLPPMSVGNKSTSNSSVMSSGGGGGGGGGGGLAARIIDPLKKRRQRVTSVGELPVVMTSSSKEMTSMTSLEEPEPPRHAPRSRRRHIFSSSLTQGSL